MKQEVKVDNILLQCSIALASSIFIELSNSLVGEDLTPLSSLMKPLKHIFQSKTSLLSKPSTHVGSIQSIFFAYTQSCCQDKPPMSYVLWIMTISFSKTSNCCRILPMGTFCLNCCPSIQMLTTLPKCKTWIESMMAILGTSWSQQI